MSNLVALADAVHLENRPLPKAPDGRYDWQVRAKTETDRSGDAMHSHLYKTVHKAEDAYKRIKSFNPSLIPAFADAVKNPDAIDDRTDIFTNGLAYLCSLPQGSNLEKKLNDDAIALLYNSLPHPPATFLGTAVPLAPTPAASKSSEDTGNGAVHGGLTFTINGQAKTSVQPAAAQAAQGQPPAGAPRIPYAFRSADGSDNNVLLPNLGKAGMPYARSVQNKHPFAPNTLPDPGVVFDSLLKARDWKPHPGGNSSLTFAFASLVTHQLFRTDRRDQTINNTSSYLDLSILYGINQAQQDQVRDKERGLGYLYPDCFAEDRLVLVPPASSALLVIFSRNHNYICDMLLNINERKRWFNPPPQDPVQRAAQDEEIFQTARLVNCGHFMAMIFGDYVAGFLGLGRDGNTWSMNPFDPIKDKDGIPVTRGEGNHCSVEFNLLYRWHATTSQTDIGWTQDLFSRLFVGQNLQTTTLKDFGPAVARAWTTVVDPNPRTRTFSNLKRGPDGKFSDDDLANVLQDATESMAAAYRARGTPEILRLIEIMGMVQGRQWGVCSMNEFRKFLGLKPFSDFDEWSSDKEVAAAARQLYGHIDNLELYPGLQAEDCMKLGPGSGICCGYTMTRAILGDAIALVRGDRFYTTDYTPNNLTVWGFQDCARDPTNGAFGAALPKLLFRHLPRHYPANSAYALFPFFTPDTTRQNLTKLGLVQKYAFERPKPQPIPKVIDTMAAIHYVFNDHVKFTTPYESDMRLLTKGYGFLLVFDETEKHGRDLALALHALFPDKSSMPKYVDGLKNLTRKMIKENSYKLQGVPGTRVDIVRNVINLVFVHWVTDYLFGINLKTEDNPKGLLTEQEVYDMLTVLFTCVFLDISPEHGWVLREGAFQVSEIINSFIEKSINEVAPSTSSNLFSGIYNVVSHLLWPTNKPYHAFLGKLAESGRPVKELMAEVLGLTVGSSVNYAQQTVQIIDFYLDPARAKERAEIQKLITRNDAESAELLRGYVREGQRLCPQFAGLLRIVSQADSIPVGSGKPNVNVVPGDIVFASFRNAHLNPVDFPDPHKVDPRRPKEKSAVLGTGFHRCPGVNFVEQAVPEILKIVFGLKNLRRAEGAAGQLDSFMLPAFGTDNQMYLDNTGNPTPWPGSLTVVYDE